VSAITAAVLAGGWVLGWVLAGRRRTLPVVAAPVGARVSVIIPVRNEGGRLPRLFAKLAADPRRYEVLVVDDGSTDGTATLARAAGATVVPSDRPPGWSGKAYACWVGAQAALGDLLVFLDADVEPGVGAVDALAGAAASAGGLVSAQPVHRVERPYELLSAAPGLVSLLGAGTGARPPRRWWRRPMAFGPAMAIPADAYRRVGGHGAVRGEVVDDVALAAATDRAGVPVASFLAGSHLTYRMYPDGLATLVEGWTKNLASGGASTPPLRLAAVAVWVTASLSAGLALGESGMAAASVLPAVAAYLAFATQFHVLARRVGRFGPASLVFPLLIAVFVVLFIRSAVATFGRRQVRWRGRLIEVGRAR
jgi:4,4'-diaponeurosporenoate glycosyltransferase